MHPSHRGRRTNGRTLAANARHLPPEAGPTERHSFTLQLWPKLGADLPGGTSSRSVKQGRPCPELLVSFGSFVYSVKCRTVNAPQPKFVDGLACRLRICQENRVLPVSSDLKGFAWLGIVPPRLEHHDQGNQSTACWKALQIHPNHISTFAGIGGI